MASSSSPRLIALDLFSGCGGLTEGLKRAGFDVIGAIEFDRQTSDTFKLNHPTVRVWNKDIREVSVPAVKRRLGLKVGTLDLLAGCPPCQGFSKMRTLNGKKTINDPKNDLLMEFLRFVEGLRPKAVMMENVPGLAQDRRFKLFCDRLAEMGYNGQHRILDAAEYGVPQRRRRLIYLAGPVTVSFARPKGKAKTVKSAFSNLAAQGQSGDPIHDLPERRSKRILALIKSIPHDGGSRTSLSKRRQLPCHKKCDGFKDVYGRMAWDQVAPTITSGCFNPSKGRFLHPVKNRAITMREAALLQGFPRKYKFDVTAGKTGIALMIGNALPPPFISAHAREIKKALLIRQGKKKDATALTN
jgi:DNA (cytosine-5)-methyltransferase 1